MARVTVEDCLEQEPNRFALILLAAKRTKQILSGSRPTVEGVKNKPVVTALREIAAGVVRFMTDQDLEVVKERERRAREETLARAAAERELRAAMLAQAAASEVAAPEVSLADELGDEDGDDEVAAVEEVPEAADDEDDAGTGKEDADDEDDASSGKNSADSDEEA